LKNTALASQFRASPLLSLALTRAYNDLEEIIMGLSDQPFEVMCPDCGAMLTVDPVTRSVIGHKSAPKKKMFEDFGEAAKALREADARRDSIFQQSVDAQKNKDDVLAKKFAEAVKKAKETPMGERPLRDFDLD
jgi:hypothetical protein